MNGPAGFATSLRDAATWPLLLALALASVRLARRDRDVVRPSALPGRAALPLPRPPGPPPDLLRSQAELERATEEMRSAAESADRARRELESVRADIDRRQEELKRLKDDADERADRATRDLEEARSRLDGKRDELERTAAAAERRVIAARTELLRLETERVLRERRAAAEAAAESATMDQAARWAARALPPRPDARQLDQASGAITWPEVLRDDEYRDRTETVERCFRDRAAAGVPPGAELRRACDDALDDLVGRLRANVSRHPAGRYGDARTFLDGLRREFPLPPGP